MLMSQLSLLRLVEFKFVHNCLNGIFEEISVLIDSELRQIEQELDQKTNL